MHFLQWVKVARVALYNLHRLPFSYLEWKCRLQFWSLGTSKRFICSIKETPTETHQSRKRFYQKSIIREVCFCMVWITIFRLMNHPTNHRVEHNINFACVAIKSNSYRVFFLLLSFRLSETHNCSVSLVLSVCAIIKEV